MDGSLRVVTVDRGRFDEAVEVLALAYGCDPSFASFLGFDPADGLDLLRPMFQVGCAFLIQEDHPVLAVYEGTAIVAVAGAMRPLPRNDLWRSERYELHGIKHGEAISSLPSLCVARLMAYQGMCAETEPQDHYQVSYLGVVPAHQRRGLARVLLQEIETRAAAGGCAGVALSTWDPGRRAFYEKCGYAVCSSASEEGIEAWTLVKRVHGDRIVPGVVGVV